MSDIVVTDDKITITCDGCGATVEGGTVKETTDRYMSSGWKPVAFINGEFRDYCPDCRAKRWGEKK